MAESRNGRPTGGDARPSGGSPASSPLSTRLLVAVCTYRRPEMLRSLLSELALQEPSAQWRVLVVDNDPACSAAAVTPLADPRLATRVDYLSAPSGHLASARNAALDEAEPDECVVFIDDDEIPCHGWLEAMATAHRASPEAVIVGPVRPKVVGPPPSWAPDLWFFKRQEFPDGADVPMAGDGNALLPPRLHAVLRLRYKVAFDGIGAQDTDLFTRWKDTGGRIVWVSRAVVHETVPESRTTLRYPYDRARASAYGYGRFYIKGPGTWIERTATIPVRAAQGVLLMSAGRITRDPVRRARGLVRTGQAWGTLQAVVGYRPPPSRKRLGVDDVSR